MAYKRIRHAWLQFGLPGLVLAAAMTWLLPLPADTGTSDPKRQEAALLQTLQKARVNGKYGMLLAQYLAPDDAKTYGEFSDQGFTDEPDWISEKNAPAGHYVYVAPYWFAWRDIVAEVGKEKRSWGPEQVVGEPDTQGPGDISTAWASRTQDGADEWLLLEYASPIVPRLIHVHETHNPGALVRATVFNLQGEEVEIWKGKDPTPVANGWGIGVLAAKVDFKITRVKLYFDSKSVPGWNEIDAVGVTDDKGKVHWAAACEASSTYASSGEEPRAVNNDRVRQLEREVRALRKTVAELKRQIDELKARK